MNGEDQNLAENLGNIDLNAQQIPPQIPQAQQQIPQQQQQIPQQNMQQQQQQMPQFQAQNLDPVVSQLKVITHELSSAGAYSQISTYNGDNPRLFRSWIKEVTKYCVIINADDDRRKRILFGTARGVVSSFIERFFLNQPNADSQTLIRDLTTRFSDVVDEQSAIILFRNLRQSKSESITSFYEKILVLAEQAFPGANLAIPAYQTQLIMYFTDGLIDDRIARHVIRARPKSLDEALTSATSEYSMIKQLDARGKTHFSEKTTHRTIEPMEIDTVAKRNPPPPPFRGFCFKCNKQGHKAAQCYSRSKAPQRQMTRNKTLQPQWTQRSYNNTRRYQSRPHNLSQNLN